MKKILMVAAHPDDEILGCGGTIARLVDEGYLAYTLILGEGITARDQDRDIEKRKKQLSGLKRQTLEANKILKVKSVFTHSFPDNRFDTVPLLSIVKVIEKISREVNPNIIFTHYKEDLNIDHQIAYKAVIAATRPLFTQKVKEIYSFEVLSSTEWSYPLAFQPDTFFDITEWLEYKLKAMKNYKTELRGFPHPRSLEGIKLNAAYWGMRVGFKYAEAFKAVRILR